MVATSSGHSGSSGGSGAPGAGRWLSLAQAAAAQGVGPDALRKRIPTGQVRARKRGGRWQVWVPAADLGIRIIPDAPDTPDHPESGNPDPPDIPDPIPDRPDHQEPPPAAQATVLAQRAQEMAAYTERLLEPLHARLEAQAERIGRLEEQLAAAQTKIAVLETPAPEPEGETQNAPPAESWPEGRAWWQKLLWG